MVLILQKENQLFCLRVGTLLIAGFIFLQQAIILEDIELTDWRGKAISNLIKAGFKLKQAYLIIKSGFMKPA